MIELLRRLVDRLLRTEADRERRRRLQEEALASIEHFRAADRLRRDEVHDRDALR
ncbi:MAG: hypothetical protein KJ058_14765 [Thermoanaerobaculia bacterium]|nr:hypothetical protein [Thermoanaerobaculia bacterium]